jgi:peptidyl-prolyl cis-trans isomerase B (cyclophilin B)
MSNQVDYSKTRATIETNKGTFVVSFFADKAPLHVENFVQLAKAGKYDGVHFHRIIPNFMIQGGDFENIQNPSRMGTGGHSWKGPGSKLKAEFNDTPHDKGILSAARTSDPNSAGSQFFVCVARVSSLDRQYSAFGKVESGYEVVEAISKVKTGAGDKPVEPVVIKKVTIS